MVKIFVCGDVVNHTPNNSFIGDNLSKIISDADFAVCNFEGPELKKGQTASCPHQESGTAYYLHNVGFDLMLLANNHITELGAEGVQYSIDTIKSTGADFVGAGLTWDECYAPLVKEINGKLFGFYNICEAQVGQFLSREQEYGYAWMGYDGLYDNIKDLSSRTDYVVVFVHAGLEHYDIPLPEIREFYKELCDAGAAAVIGGHTHCAQGYEFYNDKLIVYSLGNFFFPIRERWPHEAHSYSVILGFEEGEISVEPVFHYNDGHRVCIDESGVICIDYLNELLGAKYDLLAEKTVEKAYTSLCKKLLVEATCGQDDTDGLKGIVYKFLIYFVRRKKYVYKTRLRRQRLLLHLLENETYRWIIINYLKKNSHV